VVRRFNLADILLVRRLQERGACLDLETALLWSPDPLSLALMECLSLTQGRSNTFVQDDHSVDPGASGFLQAWDRANGQACDVQFISPSLDGSTATTQLWCDLLQHLSVIQGESGLQRIFAKAPVDGRSADVLRQSGFSAYARRNVFRLNQLPPHLPNLSSKRLRPAEERDASALKRFLGSLTPRLVQQVEGGPGAENDPTAVIPWWKSREIEEDVWEESGEVQACLRLVSGQRGHWLRILLDPGAAQGADAILSELLSAVVPHPDRPIYCAVREYESGLRPALEAFGFDLVASELLMARHTTAPARVKVDKLSPALEKGVETAAPISTSNHCQDAT
jgi:hypothetical protein